jgi:hypothetical protein
MAKSKRAVEEKPLKAREIAFVENYIANGENGTRAVLETPGFNVSTADSAGVIANRLLRNVKIKAEIERRKAELRAKIEEKTEISRITLVHEFQANLKQARELEQMAAANSAVTGQAKLLGYDTPERGGSDIGTVNVIIFGGPEQEQRLESEIKVIESEEAAKAMQGRIESKDVSADN